MLLFTLHISKLQKLLMILIIPHYFNEFYELIEDSSVLQADGATCKLLGKTPSQIRKLEEDGFLSYEEKIFLWAYQRWEMNFCLENRVSLF